MSEPVATELPADAEHRLRVAVERAVRPVFAGEMRKLRMRKELLDHAIEAYSAESARGADPDSAADRAIERLGDPAALTAELDAGVPWSDRVSALTEWAARRPPGGSYARHAVWMACLFGAIMAALLIGSSLLVEVGVGPERLRFSVPLVKTMAFITITYGLIAAAGAVFGGRVRDAIEAARGRIPRVAVFWAACGGGAVWLLGHMAWLIVALPAMGWSAAFSGPWTALSVVFAVSALALSWIDLQQRREVDAWLKLDLS